MKMPKYEVTFQYKVRHTYQVDADTEIEAIQKFDQQWNEIDWNSDNLRTKHWNSRMHLTTIEEKVDEEEERRQIALKMHKGEL